MQLEIEATREVVVLKIIFIGNAIIISVVLDRTTVKGITTCAGSIKMI